jgi:hypothetical protein
MNILPRGLALMGAAFVFVMSIPLIGPPLLALL